jgi:hypothetical protein
MTKTIDEKKVKLTDAERQKRFEETAKKIGASENIKDFDRAFDGLRIKKPPAQKSSSRDAT